MPDYPHDIDLGPKPDDRERHRILSNARHDPTLLTVLHYLRDEAADCIGRSTDALRNAQPAESQMELGAHEILMQVFTKFDELRKKPVPVEGLSS